MVDVKYDYCASVKIGYAAGFCTTITNVLYYADEIVVVDGDGEVEPIPVINTVHPVGVSGRHKHWKMTVALDSNDMEAIYTQVVQNGVATSRAIREDADNDFIEYFVVSLVKLGGGTVTVTFDADSVWCTLEKESWSFLEGVEFQPTILEFICIENRTEI